MPILEVVVVQGETQIEDTNIKAVKKQKTFTKIKEVESFIGFVNFYKYFIKNFSYIEKPLNELKYKKEQKQEEEYQKAFKYSKDKITSQLVLST